VTLSVERSRVRGRRIDTTAPAVRGRCLAHPLPGRVSRPLRGHCPTSSARLFNPHCRRPSGRRRCSSAGDLRATRSPDGRRTWTRACAPMQGRSHPSGPDTHESWGFKRRSGPGSGLQNGRRGPRRSNDYTIIGASRQRVRLTLLDPIRGR
jgi:hypothetical protein